MLKKILIKNGLYKIEILERLREYYLEKKNKDISIKEFVKESSSIYLTIIFGIIGVYTSMNLNITTEELLLGVLNIVSKSIGTYLIIFIVYMIFKMRNLSITNFYTYYRLNKLLNELIIRKIKQKTKVKYKNFNSKR